MYFKHLLPYGMSLALVAACATVPEIKHEAASTWNYMAFEEAKKNVLMQLGVEIGFLPDILCFMPATRSPDFETKLFQGDFVFAKPDGSAAGSIEAVIFPSNTSLETFTKSYISSQCVDFEIKSVKPVRHPAGIPGAQILAQRKDTKKPMFILILVPNGSRRQYILQYNGEDEEAGRIFSSFKVNSNPGSSRKRPGLPTFTCPDGTWIWESDRENGFVLSHREDSNFMVAVVGTEKMIKSLSNLSPENYDLSSTELNCLFDYQNVRLSASIYSLKDNRSPSNDHRNSLRLYFKLRDKDFGLFLSMREKPRISPDGRLDEPAIEALLSTYLSFEELKK